MEELVVQPKSSRYASEMFYCWEINRHIFIFDYSVERNGANLVVRVNYGYNFGGGHISDGSSVEFELAHDKSNVFELKQIKARGQIDRGVSNAFILANVLKDFSRRPQARELIPEIPEGDALISTHIGTGPDISGDIRAALEEALRDPINW